MTFNLFKMEKGCDDARAFGNYSQDILSSLRVGDKIAFKEDDGFYTYYTVKDRTFYDDEGEVFCEITVLSEEDL